MYRGILMVNEVLKKKENLISARKKLEYNIVLQKEPSDNSNQENNSANDSLILTKPSTSGFQQLNTEDVPAEHDQLSLSSSSFEDFTVSGSDYQPLSHSSFSDISTPTGSPFTPKIRKSTLYENDNTQLEKENSPKQKTRKRIKNPKTWKKNINKIARIRGLSYSSSITCKTVPAKEMKQSCFFHCRQKCFERISEADRNQNFSKFYSLENNILQWKYILNHVEKHDKKLTKIVSSNSRRSCTNVYFLSSFNNDNIVKVKVCNKMFLNTLSISSQMVETAFTKLMPESGNILGDKRGKHIREVSEIDKKRKQNVKGHINSFAPIESHYLRMQTTRQYIDNDLSIAKMHRLYEVSCKERNDTGNVVTLRQYRDVFNNCSNIGFYIPKKDQCNACSKYNNMTQEEKSNNEDEYNMHIFSKKKARILKDENKARVIEDDTVIIATFDFQKILNIPCEKTSVFYYKRKFCIFNFTIFEIASLQGFCFVWDETIAKEAQTKFQVAYINI